MIIRPLEYGLIAGPCCPGLSAASICPRCISLVTQTYLLGSLNGLLKVLIALLNRSIGMVYTHVDLAPCGGMI